MPNGDNAARRLHMILVEARNQNPNQSVWQAWASIFKGDNREAVEVFEHLSLLWQLVDEVENRIRSIDNIKHDTYLKNFISIRKALAVTNLDTKWSIQKNYLTESTIRDVEFCAEKIAEYSDEVLIEEKELNDLLEEINHLFSYIKDIEIELELKNSLLRILEVMRRAIVEYRITGASGLHNALARAVGELILSQRYQTDEEQKKNIFSKICPFLTKIDVLLSKIRKCKPFLDAVKQILLPESIDTNTNG